MFTGLVEAIGRIRQCRDAGEAVVVTVEAPFTADLAVGDSVAVSGVCLTVTCLGDGTFTADMMPETLACTTARTWREGTAVNLERALALGGRLGGHVVQGHVDGTAKLVAREPGPRWDTLTFACVPTLGRYIAYKGSICVDGVSLTVSGVDEAGFTVSLIPATLAATTLGQARVGEACNIETDVLARYAERLSDFPKDAE